MRTVIALTLKPCLIAVDCRYSRGIVTNNTAQKHVWRAQIVLLESLTVSAPTDMRQTGTLETCVLRWQERFMQQGFDGLFRDKTRPFRASGRWDLTIAERVVTLTQSEPPARITHWTFSHDGDRSVGKSAPASPFTQSGACMLQRTE